MARKTSGDSTLGVSHDIFPGIQDSFTTQGLPPEMARSTPNRVRRPFGLRVNHPPEPTLNLAPVREGSTARTKFMNSIVRHGGGAARRAFTGPTVPLRVA